MAIITRSTVLEAPADAVWEAVKTPVAFRTVTRGLLAMPAIKHRHHGWIQGETVVGWVFLFGAVPWARHHLHVAVIDDGNRIMRSLEHGGVVKRWNHDIAVVPMGPQRCGYSDTIEIDAGMMTGIVTLYARFFYALRQRRWRVLARELAR